MGFGSDGEYRVRGMRPLSEPPRRPSLVPPAGWLERREARTSADFETSERIGREIEEAENA